MTNILFIDDEQPVLSGIRRALRSKRSEWTMRFACGGDEGLALVAERAPDVVVTDVRLRGGGGERVLRRLAQDYPDTIRIVLSGYADNKTSLRTLQLAHQYLAKPCPAEELVQRLERIVGLRRLLHGSLRAELGGVKSLPAAPRVYNRLVEVLESEAVTSEGVAEVVESDPAITAVVLKVVNSAFIGLPRTIDSVDRAVVLLGAQMVGDIVLAADAMRSVGVGMESMLERFQEHSAAVAMLARKLAPAEHVGVVRTAGFLHDLGSLFLAARHRADMDLLRGEVTEEQTLHHRLMAHHHVSQAELGGYLLGMWGLPLPLVDAVAASSKPRWAALGSAEIVHVADALIHELTEGTPYSSHAPLDEQALERLGLTKQLVRWRKAADRVVYG